MSSDPRLLELDSVPDGQLDASKARSLIKGVPGRDLLVIAVLLFVGNFFFARLFTVYDDDFIFTVPPFFWSSSEAWAHIQNSLLTWPQGRPVGFALTYLLSYLSAQSSSLGLGYLLGFLILLFNAALIKNLAQRFVPVSAALFAAAMYVLYPADTSRVILMHRVNLHLNVTFLLLALTFYMRGRRWLAYVLAPLSFLIHEPVYAVVLVAPLLVARWRDLSWKRCLGHGAICGATVAMLLLFRRHLGDPRIAETFGDPAEVVRRIGVALFVGPTTVLGTMVTRPFEALHATDAQIWIPVLFCAAAYYWAGRGKDSAATPPTDNERRESALCLAGAGAVALLLGYILCFRDDYWPPVMTIGRIAGYHVSGSVGASWLCAGLLGWLLAWRPAQKRILLGAVALYLGLLVSFGLEVQRIDYVRHAEQQQGFWRTILDTSGEWQPDTVVLVDISGSDSSLPYTPGMPLWWTVNFAPTLLERLVEWPESWSDGSRPNVGKTRPRVWGYQPSFETMSEGENVVVKTPSWLSSDFWPRVRDRNFIYYKFAGGHMVRVVEPVVIGGRSFQPMPHPSTPQPELKTTRFHDMLFSKETGWSTIRRAKNYPR